MKYHLANMKVSQIGEEVFGSDLSAMSFRYNKHYKYWYRVTNNNIIQFLGLARYNSGRYDLSFICQPLYVPLFHSYFDDRRGVAPSFEEFQAGHILTILHDLNLPIPEGLPALKGFQNRDSLEDIKRHMCLSFQSIVKPVFEKAIDVPNCYSEYMRLQKLRNDMVRKHGTLDYWKTHVNMTCILELMLLLDMQKYSNALERILADKMEVEKKRKDSSNTRFETLYSIALNHDTLKFEELKQSYSSDTIKKLQNCGFII